MKFSHRIKTVLLSAVLFGIVSILTAGQNEVMADPAWSTIDELGVYDEDHSLYYDRTLSEDGEIVFITDDARRTSPIYYHTVGFKFYRCYPGTKTRDESTYIVIMLPDPTHEYYYATPSGGTRVRAIWKFDFETQILHAISQVSEQWYQEVITQEQETWLRADGIMQVCFDDDRDGKLTGTAVLSIRNIGLNEKWNTAAAGK